LRRREFGLSCSGQAGTVDFRLTNAIDAALANQPISVALGSATPVTGVTDINGVYKFAFTAQPH
jgi:hypothetical protein